ncbi:MAG: bifunctional diaminohydroxyphosphoribosylaminopyrimidine deaminase/5-amino-6-(5-phosphoribosylamino)uracil reductase RibD [Kocuria sp.]|nr:bifunctional diaminohydroxyphosphoribosylaminopyrimidine deaminase/5-amino-6-(5-phosphoribosylamino)uracil reductase RibD [Kocuria sp.]
MTSPGRSQVFTAAETHAMEIALRAALGGPRGANPLVGAVILDANGAVLHVGHHRGAGSEHAEVDALYQARAAGTQLRDCTMVVTLEPCNHTGRTGPCATAIVSSGIKRVIYAVADTTVAASGGADTLRAGGIEVCGGLLAQRAQELNHRWALAQQQRRPFVTVKTAQSIDGRIAAADGTSQWITGEEARAHAHQIRHRVDAIVVGTQTVLTDDPRLTVRGLGYQGTGADLVRPLRVAMGHRTVPEHARMRGVDGRFRHMRTHDPEVVVTQLYDDGARHLLVEGGATVVGAFLAADMADELVLYQAPMILGAGQSSYPESGITTLSQAWRYMPDPSDGGPLRQLGHDLLWHLQPSSTLTVTTCQEDH